MWLFDQKHAKKKKRKIEKVQSSLFHIACKEKSITLLQGWVYWIFYWFIKLGYWYWFCVMGDAYDSLDLVFSDFFSHILDFSSTFPIHIPYPNLSPITTNPEKVLLRLCLHCLLGCCGVSLSKLKGMSANRVDLIRMSDITPS